MSVGSSETRAKACEKTPASFSMPFMRMTRQRVKASTSCFRYGGCAICFQVRTCFSSGVPFSLNGFMPMLVPSF